MCIHVNTCLLPPPPLQFQAGPVLPLSLILLNKRHKHNTFSEVSIDLLVAKSDGYTLYSGLFHILVACDTIDYSFLLSETFYSIGHHETTLFTVFLSPPWLFVPSVFFEVSILPPIS
jgi:hypothetical protein